MIKKLKLIGIHDTELKWFRNYLTGRKQKTNYKGMMSNDIEVPIGLPQGTALSVILFTLYIDSITKILKHGKNNIIRRRHDDRS